MHYIFNIQVICTTSSANGLCEGTIPLPAQWFSHSQDVASVSITARFLNSFNTPQQVGTVTVRPRPSLSFTNDIALVLPGRPIQRTQLFDVPVYAHSTYSVATFGIRCEVNSQLGIENIVIDQNTWISEVRPQDYQGMADMGVVAILRNPEGASEVLLTQPEMIFSLQIRVLQTASEGDVGTINCTTAHLSNVYDVKIQPRGMVTPTPSIVFDSNLNNDATIGEIRVAQSVPRGLFSYATQSQIINTAVVNLAPVRLSLVHLVAMSSGMHINASTVTCQSSSQAFQLTPTCGEVILNGSEDSGADSDIVLTQVGEFSSSLTVRVWYPVNNVVLESARSTLNAVQSWLTPVPDSSGRCQQNYQQAKLSAFTDFAYSDLSPSFRASVFPLLATQLRVSNSSVIEVSDEGLVTALMPGASTISAGPIVSPTTVVVTDEEVEVSSLDITVFSGLSLNIPTSPYPLVSSQSASVNVERDFASVNTSVFIAVLAVTSDGSPLQVSESDGLIFTSLNSSVIEVNNGNISLIGSGSNDLLQVSWQSPCTGETIVMGTASLDVNIPEPESLQVELSSSRITYTGDTATFGGIPTTASLSVILHYPDGLTRGVTSDVRTQFAILQGDSLVTLTVMDSEARIEPSDPTSTELGDVIISVSFGSVPPLAFNVSLSVVRFLGVDIFANPYPPYPGSDLVQKSTFFQVENTGMYQRGALQLHALLTDGTSVSVTDSPLVFFQSFSPAIIISGNVFQASQAGTYRIQGQLGPNSATVNLTVSNTPVVISSFVRLSLSSNRDTLQGLVQVRDPLELDVQFSDNTEYPRFIPDATTLFPSLISLTSDTPTAASISSATGNVTLLSNHHSLVTITATKRSDNRVQSQISFACNLEPSIGDVDIGSSSGIPIPPIQSGSTFSVPLLVNAGSQFLTSAQLAILHGFENVDLLMVTASPNWPGTVVFSDSPSTGLLTLTANSELGASGLVHIATLDFMATSSGVSSIGGVILQLLDVEGVAIGDGRMRQFTAGQVSFEIFSQSNRKRRHVETEGVLLRTRRNTQCTSPLPCSICPDERELGDVNGDCIFSEVDPLFLLQYHAESLFDFELQSGMALLASLIPAQESNLDSDLNTAIDLQDAYFLLQTNAGFLNFLRSIHIRPVQESGASCSVVINATLLSRRNMVPDSQLTEVFFDIGLPFDPTFTTQQLYDRLIIIRGTAQPTANKGLALQGGIIKASPLEPGVFGVEFQTNLTLSNTGLSVIQVTSPDGQSTNQARTKAMFGHPDPPFTFSNPLDITVPSFTEPISVLASYGYSPFISFSNNLSSGVCLTPPGPPIINQTLYTAQVAENTVTGTPILTFTAQSQSDLPVTFSIASGNTGDRFTIHPSIGVLSVSGLLDFEMLSFYRLQLIATDPATSFTSSSTAEISIIDINDNEPVFSQVISNISIPANSPIGSLVTLVTASDADSGTNAIIEFRIASDGDTFAIDSTLGTVTLAASLNFDLQNFHTVIITATDQGIPHMSSTVMLNITIEPPDPTLLQFDSPVYLVNVTENAPIGLTILQVHAAPVSNETSNGNTIVYTLDTSAVPFSIVPETGELRVSGGIDREMVDLFELQVSATLANTDRAIPARAVVAVDILDINDNAPDFFEDLYTAFLDEELPPGSLNLVVTATDPDLNENGTVEYSLEETYGLFSINSASGRLTNTQPLDYETNQTFTLTVTASDMGSPGLANNVDVVILITDTNDNAPTITINPPSEIVLVAENHTIGNPVARASATDLDSTMTNGAITFSLSSVDGSSSSVFSIDFLSGEITTLALLDFETIQLYVLTVTASDSGTPRLSTHANLTVSVTDVNDNPPIFVRDNFNLVLSEATKLGAVLLQLEASDNDTGINAELFFALESEIPATNNFNITENGAIVLIAPLDFETEQMYSLIVSVTNIVPGTDADFANIQVSVTDFNEFPPVFSEDNYTATVVEEALDAFVVQVTATDMDITSNVTYLLDNSAFSIDAEGNIYTLERLDREAVSEYTLMVTASDNSEPLHSSSVAVIVTVLDINDNAPVISPFSNLTISENTMIASVLLMFTATDIDAGVNGDIGNFTLFSPSSVFTLTTDGQLILADRLDAILVPLYILTIQVEDNGSPPLSSTADISIKVEASPSPFFEQPSYSVVIEENNQPSAFLVQVTAVSRNPMTVIEQYFLSSESELEFDGLFAVDPTSGNVTALVGLDREQQNEYSITIVVRATLETMTFSANATVSVILQDQNDNAPRFEFDSQTVSIPETTKIGSIISTVIATDRDVLSNAEIVYSIVSGNNEGFFSINQDGNITTMRSLQSQIGAFNITIQAANPLAVGELSSLTQLQIEVDPVNDFAPQFSMEQYSINVLENITIGTTVVNINATDADVGTAGEISYSISAGNEQNRFSIDGLTGELLLVSGLDYEATPMYNLTVTATDNGTLPRSSDALVAIQVIDVNDNRPIFSQSVYRGQLLENQPAGQSIATVIVSDEDSPLNARIVLEVVTPNLNSTFTVTPAGEVQNLVPLDREIQSDYTLVIMAINVGSGIVLSDNATVVIEILDENDNAPQFLQSVYSRVLRALVEANTTVLQVQANDIDLPGNNTEVRFSLEGAMDAFAVDPISGVIITVQELTSEVNITFSVIATDLGSPSMSSQASVMITVLPAHDLTAGRERDLEFSTEAGIHLISDSVEIAENTYQQQYGFLVGRDIREPRSISANLGTLTGSVRVSPTSLPAASVTAVLISSLVWHDNPIIQVAVQARDEAHSVHIQVQVTARVTHPTQGTSQQSSCTTQLTDGTCIISVSLPDTWFSAQVNVTVEYGLSVNSLQHLRTAKLQQRPTFDIGSNIYVYMEMPLKNLFRNDFFEVNVFGETGSKAVGSFTITVSVASSVRLLSLDFDGSLWQAQTQVAPDGSGSITITAIRADQSNTPPLGRVQLFTIRAQVSPSSPVDTLVADAVLGNVISLSDFDRMMLLPAPDVSFIRASALSRNGITASGAIFVADDRVVGLLPFTSQAAFVNTAFLNGTAVSFPITVLEVRLSGSVSQGNSALCSSADPLVITVTPNCSSLQLTSSPNQPSNGTNILVSQDTIFAAFPVEVWTPQEFVLTSDDTTLNQIPELLDPQANCSPSWQYSDVKCFANFSNSQVVIQRVDVTDILAPLLSTTDSSILRIAGNRVRGLQSGVAQVQLTGILGVTLSFTVTEQPMELLGIDVQIISGLRVSGSQNIGRQSIAPLTIISEQTLDFEGVQAVSIASAVFDDGFRLQLSSSDVTFTSLDSNIVQLSDGNIVAAVGTGQGGLVQATWRPATQCATEPIATGFGLVDVTIPLPSDIITAVPSPVLALPNSTATFIGIPTITTIQITAVYSDGRRQDLTTDNRTIYAIPSGLSISRGAQVTIGTENSPQIEEHVIQVSFSQFPGLERNVTITVVEMSDIALRAIPYPEYPGSSSNLLSMLHPIAETGVRQQALILADAVLSNGDRRDISSQSELQFGITTSPSNVQSSISNNTLTVLDVFSFGSVTIRGTLREVNSRSSLRLELSPVPVYIASIRISPFPESNTFRGTIGSTRQVVISATLDDGRQYVNLFQDYNLPNFVTFAASPTSALTVGSTTGIAILQGNSLTPATITVSAVMSDGTQTLQVNCNLDPEVGDIDLGSLIGVITPPQVVGSMFTIPVRVNSGTSILNSIDLDITFDPTVIRARSASTGPNWPSTGQFTFTIDDPVDFISVGGTLVGSAPVRGSALHLINVQFEAIGAGTVNISGMINTLAEQSAGGAPASNIGTLPREFVAGSVQMQVTGSRRRREVLLMANSPQVRSRRQSASCSNPPCDVCTPFREHGDVDGNCVFDVRDASFLQLYYLTTITTGTAPAIPTDRQAFLDLDMNGAVDPNDVVFMLRVNFRLLRFITNAAFTSVQDSRETCLLSFNVTLLRDGATVADNSSTALIIDFAHEDSTFQQMFDNTIFTLGTVLHVSKGTGLFGGFVEAQYMGEGIYGVIAESAINQVNLGLSPILVTFDGTGASSAIRTAALFSQGVPRYGNLDASIILREQTIRITTQLGYSPLVTVSSSLTTEQCRLQNLPLVFENSTYDINVTENTTLGTTVLQIQATSNRPNTVIAYSLNSNSSLPFTVNPATGFITLTSLLDFESTTLYEFEAVAEESTVNGQFTASVPITISITNVNDLPPVVSPVGTIQLLATVSSTDEVIRVTAIDPDSLDSLTFSLIGSSTSFAIDGDTGAITATTNLTTIANQLIRLNVSVSDGLFTVHSEILLDIYLPSFTQDLYSAVISESTPIGSVVLSVAVQDFREESFVFAIESAQTVFQINSSGIVILREAVDFEVESQRSFTFRISANSAVIVLRAEISITVTNENDNVPVFSQSQYNVTIPSSTPVGTQILQVEATDDDFGLTSAITYVLLSSPNVDLFRIDTTTGELFLAQTLLGRSLLILLNISATDAGEPPISSFVEVEIQVTAADVLAFPIPPLVSASDSVLALSEPQRIMDNSNDSVVIFEQSFGKLASPQTGLLTASYPNVSVSQSVGSELLDGISATVALLHPSRTVYHDGRQVSFTVQVRDSKFQTSAKTSTQFSVRATSLTLSETVTSSPCTPHTVYGTCIATVTLPQRWFAQSASSVALDPLLNGRIEGVSQSLILVSLQPAPTLPTSILNEVLVELPSRDIIAGESFTVNVYGYSTYSVSGFSVLFNFNSTLTSPSLVIDSSRWSTQTVIGANSFGVSAILSNPDQQNTPLVNPMVQLFSLQLSTSSSITTQTATITALIQSLTNVVEGSVVLSSTNTNSGPAFFIGRGGGLSNSGKL